MATLSSATVASLLIMSAPAAAAHGTLECEPPDSLLPLIELLHSITELAFLGGTGLGVLGFSAAGILFMIPGQENNRRAKILAKSVLIGTILLLSANMIVSFIVNELGGVVC